MRHTADLRAAWIKFKASRWRRIVEVAIVALALVWMARALALNLAQINTSDLRFDVASLLVALLITWITVWIGTLAWAIIIRALHPQVPVAQSIQQHLLSLPTKYLPGFGWQQISKALQLHRGGVPLGQTAVAVFVELGLVVLTGLATVAHILILRQATLGVAFLPQLQLSMLAVLWAACSVAPISLSGLVDRTAAQATNKLRSIVYLYVAEVLLAIGWLTFGLSLWFICRTFISLPLDALPECLFALIISFLVSLAIIFVPNGVGVRELMMSSLLQSVTPVPVSIVSAVMSRVILVLAEFAAALPFVVKAVRRR